MEPLSSAVAVLSAMITPAVLISACGTLVLSTSTRLGRVVDRVRDLSDRFGKLAEGECSELQTGQRSMILNQLGLLTRRAELLQRSLTLLYLAIGVFVSTVVAIGITGEARVYRFGSAAVILGLIGSCCLCYGSALLILEARMAVAATKREMDFVWHLSRRLARSHEAEDRGQLHE
jgi:hypothetical protein